MLKTKIINIVFFLLFIIVCYTQAYSQDDQFWEQLPSPTSNWLNKLHFVDSLNGWACGEAGTIIHTNNGGLSWEEYLTIPSPIIAIAFANQNTGWVVGGDGAILKTNSGGITAIDNQKNEILSIPNNFQLFQNYPNPFNPSTTISYSLPSSSLVQLKIFNILGQEVATLVNEEKQTGTYDVEFDATQLPSGIYFYRLQAGSFIEAKKMVLMK